MTVEAIDGALLAGDAVEVAPTLLGKLLVRVDDEAGPLIARIVEVEAYRWDDPASHSFRGPTTRNQSMFGPPGTAYVYLIYGVHHCLNVVTGDPGRGEAVLMRAAEAVFGAPSMVRNRLPSASVPPERLLSGPGNLCRGLGITREKDDGHSLLRDSRVLLAEWLTILERRRGRPPEPEHFRARPPARVVAGPRIGLTKATDVPWRFVDADSPALSRPPGGRLDR